MEFAEQFLDQNKKFLADDEREDILRLARAYLFFYQRDFSRAATLSKIKFDDIILDLKARGLSIRCQFEFLQKNISHYDTLIADCSNFASYVKN